jgi:signal transduction histidine kinase
MFQQLKSLFEFNCTQNDLYFKVELDPSLPTTIITDKNRLFQILVNLTGNALKFTTKGGITASAALDPSQPGKVRLSIADTGVGIKEEEKSNLFKMFGTLNTTRKQNIQGIGLGLVISNEFAKLLNLGQTGIDCQSKYKVGTTFFFYLPIKRPMAVLSADELATPGTLRQNDQISIEDKLSMYINRLAHPSRSSKFDDGEHLLSSS